MSEVAYVVLGLAVGVALAALAVRRREAPAVRGDLETHIELVNAELRRLADVAAAREGSTEHLRIDIAGARRAVETLTLREEERRERDTEAWEVVRRLASVLSGDGARGRPGENLLHEHLRQLPPGMIETDLRINGRVVEFAMLLPDGRRLPIDSKWTAVAELEALDRLEDPGERETTAREIERQVALRAREVARYLDPAMTAPVAVAAVPDAAYGVLRRAHAEAFARGVVVLPYSTALPVLLFLYSIADRFGDADDAQASLAELGALLSAMEAVLENKLAKAATMVANGADELRSGIGKARATVARGRRGVASREGESSPAGDGVLRAVP
ncbi:MAG TPA: DNA recombination protein RmuC [Actinomycetota bacterium]|jgi:hypothetical protein